MSKAASRDERPARAGVGTHDSLSLGDQLGWHGSTLGWGWWVGVLWVGGTAAARMSGTRTRGEVWWLMGWRWGLSYQGGTPPRTCAHPLLAAALLKMMRYSSARKVTPIPRRTL
eukprot:scaffold14560_cov60-Phaeocystis_antarctica.AAC.1